MDNEKNVSRKIFEVLYANNEQHMELTYLTQKSRNAKYP